MTPLQQGNDEVDKQLPSLQSSKQQSPLTMDQVPSMQSQPHASAVQQSQTGMVTGAGQPSQPYFQMGFPQQPHYTGQAPGHAWLQEPQFQPVPQAPRPITLRQRQILPRPAPQPQPFFQMGLPQQPHYTAQAPGHVWLQAPQFQSVPQAPGPVTLRQPQLPPAPQSQPQPQKPLTDSAKRKLIREQKKREGEEEEFRRLTHDEGFRALMARKEEEMLRVHNEGFKGQKALEEQERQKRAMHNESFRRLYLYPPSSAVITAHQGLHPQLSTPQLSNRPVDLYKQSYSPHPGSLLHQVQAQLQTPFSQVDNQQAAPIVPGGLDSAGRGQSLISFKQAAADLQTEQTSQSLQLQKPSALQLLLPGQTAQDPAGTRQLSMASVLPPFSTSYLQDSSPEQQAELIVPGGLVSVGHGESFISFKQAASDLQTEQTNQSFQVQKPSALQLLLPGQAVPEDSAGTTQPSKASVLPAISTSYLQVLDSNPEQVQMVPSYGGMSLPSPSLLTASIAQQSGTNSELVPLVLPIPTLISFKQAAPDLRPEQTSQSFQLPKASALQLLLPGQAVLEDPAGTTQLPEASVVPAFRTSYLQVQDSDPEQVQMISSQGNMPLPSPNILTPNTAQQFGKPSEQNMQPAAVLSGTPTGKGPSKKRAIRQNSSAQSTPAQQSASKKQKVSAGEPEDQSIDEPNDKFADMIADVNLMEEEEQLRTGPKAESRVTEAMRKIVLEAEEGLFFERGPLRAQVAAIATRCGVQSVSEDAERCLSIAVEQRIRSILYGLIELSKQRCDVDKEKHKVVITSDARRQLVLMTQRKAKELQDKKMAEESERLHELHEEKGKGSLSEVEKEELKAKAQKAQQEEDRLRANVAARTAVGADDMLLKWQMMAEKGRQKRRGEDSDAATGHGGGSSTEGDSAIHSDEKQEFKGDSAPRTISLKDVIALLEREPELSKSTLLYRLYERAKKAAVRDKGHSGNRK